MKKYVHRFTLYSLCVLSVLFVLESCKGDRSSEADKTATVEKKGEKITVTTDEGTVTVSGNEEKGQVNLKTGDGDKLRMSYGKDTIPDDFPEDVPVYAPARVTMSQIINETNSVLSLSTDDDVGTVAAFYKKELAQQGWSLKNEMTMGAMSLLQGEKGKRALNVTVSRKESETIISLVVGVKG